LTIKTAPDGTIKTDIVLILGSRNDLLGLRPVFRQFKFILGMAFHFFYVVANSRIKTHLREAIVPAL